MPALADSCGAGTRAAVPLFVSLLTTLVNRKAPETYSSMKTYTLHYLRVT
jgi:hypothetical protein